MLPKVLGDEPVIQFLAVTPHVTPIGSGQRQYRSKGNNYARHAVDRNLEPERNEPALIHNHGDALNEIGKPIKIPMNRDL